MAGRMMIVSVLALMAGCVLLKKKDPAPPTQKEPEERPASAPDEVSFPEAEKLLPATLPGWAKGVGTPPPTVLRAYLVDGDWGMTRADNNVIVGRHVRAVLFYKGGQSGKCYRSLCNLRQEEQGGSWGKAYMQCVGEYTSRVTCDSIVALRGDEP